MNSAKINTNNQHTVIKIAYNRKITIFDVEFNGIEEIKEYALKGVAKDGVYVAEDIYRENWLYDYKISVISALLVCLLSFFR